MALRETLPRAQWKPSHFWLLNEKNKKKRASIVSYPIDMVLYWNAEMGLENQIPDNKNPFASSVLGPQYVRAADGSYVDAGAVAPVDVFDGGKWLRSCGAVENLLPSGAVDFANAAWGVQDSTKSTNGFKATDTTNMHGLRVQVPDQNGGPATFSIDAKADGYSVLQLFCGLYQTSPQGVFANFNLTDGAVSLFSGGTVSIFDIGDGWFRCSISVVDNAADLNTHFYAVAVPSPSSVRAFSFLGESAKGLLLRNPQITATPYPVPYTPPGTTMPASNATVTNGCWFSNPKYIDKVAGAGVGPCPESVLPPLMVPMEGCNDPLSPNYGSYTYDGVADMCFIPKFYYKANNTLGYTFGTHGANTITIRGSETFASTAAANIAGFALHRAFIDGGVEHAGFFVDKYKCSKVAKGTGFVAGSVKNGLPLSTSSDHNPIAEITAAGTNIYAACIDAAKGRDGNNGVKNTSSIFAPISVYQRSALALFSLGYGEAADSNEFCAWYDANGVTNYPKGCNNNALRDADDTTVIYQSDGYQNCGKTGSGTPFEKTTHNGQACGVADLNGLMWEASIGMTCIATTKSITGATQASPCALTVPGHGLTTGRTIQVVSVARMTQLNDKLYTVTVIDPDTISLDGVDSTGFTAYDSGGSIAYGNFYAAKEATRMRDFTSGTSLATDHWGAVGVAAMMDEVALPLAALPGGSPMLQRFGNAANQVLSGDTSGAGHVLTGIGHPKDADGMSTDGTDLFGDDQLFQYFRDQLCVISGGTWSYGSGSGVFARRLVYPRYDSFSHVGLRCACYPSTTNDPSATPPSILGGKVRSVYPLWKALAGDEIKPSPMTLATRVRMGVGSGDLPNSSVLNALTPDDVAGRFLTIQKSAGGVLTANLSDGTNTATVPLAAWSRGDVLQFFPQVQTGGTQMRLGYKTSAAESITWGDLATYYGSFGPDTTLYKLMLGYNTPHPIWFNKIAVWNKQMDDAAILEALN